MQSSKRYCAQHSKCAGITRSEQGKYLNMFIKWHQRRQQGNFWACNESNERRPKLSTSPCQRLQDHSCIAGLCMEALHPGVPLCQCFVITGTLELPEEDIGCTVHLKGCTLADSIKRCLHSAELFSCLRLSILAGTIDSVRLMMTDTDHSTSAACDQAVVMPDYLSQSWK